MVRYITIISKYGKSHILRIGAICRNCKCDLPVDNWSMGNGNICKTCNNEIAKGRRRGVWSW